ncbi:hypothetical protein SK128_018556 [Halocaridina rubra]|uniref:Uncharacterized protein n=1 Tax=Halocaridina rubra TaxID=373956 RepID=A0AAN8XBG3_HALRR
MEVPCSEHSSRQASCCTTCEVTACGERMFEGHPRPEYYKLIQWRRTPKSGQSLVKSVHLGVVETSKQAVLKRQVNIKEYPISSPSAQNKVFFSPATDADVTIEYICHSVEGKVYQHKMRLTDAWLPHATENMDSLFSKDVLSKDSLNIHSSPSCTEISW